MIKKNILLITLLSSTILAREENCFNDAGIDPEIDSISEARSVKPESSLELPKDLKINEHSEIKDHVEGLKGIAQNALLTHLLPLIFKLKSIAERLSHDVQFQSLLKTNLEKIVNFAKPLITELVEYINKPVKDKKQILR